MADSMRQYVFQNIRRALGRLEKRKSPPVPPAIDEPITRLVHMAIGLGELFAKRAQENRMQVELLYVEQLHERLVQFLRERKCQKLALPASAFLDRLNIAQVLQEAGFEVCRTTEMALDGLYEVHCGITDVYCAVAEVGGLVIRPTPQHPRALSLVPPIHVAILEPADFVPDLVDLLDKLTQDEAGHEAVIITGPSQTADIEMNLVVGAHGPRVLQAFVLR